jgi:hypothetical protein
MRYISYVHKIYKLISKTDFSKYQMKNPGFRSFLSSLSSNVSLDEMKNIYREDIYSNFNNELLFFKKDIELMKQIKELKLYEESIATYTGIYFFWVWSNNVNLSNKDLEKITQAIFTGTMGYKLIDIHSDNNFIGQEAIFLGNRLIRLAEKIYSEVFGLENTYHILNKYFAKYCEVEYLEKRNRWKESPFSWNAVELLAYKASPLFSIFEILFRYHKFNEKKVNELVQALIYSSVAIQLMDDFVDMKDDLKNGYETLVTQGFYKKYGTENEITDEMIKEFFTEEKLLNLFNYIENLFEKSREIFTKHEDDILLLVLEFENYSFTSSFEEVQNTVVDK